MTRCFRGCQLTPSKTFPKNLPPVALRCSLEHEAALRFRDLSISGDRRALLTVTPTVAGTRFEAGVILTAVLVTSPGF